MRFALVGRRGASENGVTAQELCRALRRRWACFRTLLTMSQNAARCQEQKVNTCIVGWRARWLGPARRTLGFRNLRFWNGPGENAANGGLQRRFAALGEPDTWMHGHLTGRLLGGIREEGIHAGSAPEGMVDAAGIEPATPTMST